LAFFRVTTTIPEVDKIERGHSQAVNRLPCLDGIRAIAIGMVILAHLKRTVKLPPMGLPAPVWDYLGAAGVGLFFGLSGYLITHLLVREHRKTGRISLRLFYTRRILRIFPAYYSYLLVFSILTAAGVLAIPLSNLLAAATFSINYFPVDSHGPGWFVGHMWTVAVEQQFYLFWPLIVVAVGLTRSRYFGFALVCLMPLIRVASYFLFPELRVGGRLDAIPFTGERLMFGCLLGLLDGEPRFEAFMARFKSFFFAAILSGWAVVVGPLLEERFGGAYWLSFGITVQSFAFAFLIAWLLRNAKSFVGRLLDSRLMVFIGTISYSLYLWQQPFLTPLNSTILGYFPVSILCALLAACASYYLVEKRFLSLRSRARLFEPAGVETPRCVLLPAHSSENVLSSAHQG
jgi:peptidoglycan/LPS O-acetylase OafA/YrhL